MLFSATKSISDVPLAKQELIEDVQNWVALQTNSKTSQIEVAALDRRLKVPTCSLPFEVEFPYSKSKKTVKVKCPSSDWSIYVGVRLANEQAALVYLNDLNTGNAIGADVGFVEIDSDKGHDSFLLNVPKFLETLKGYINTSYLKN